MMTNSPPPNKQHRWVRDNLTCNAASICISVFSMIIFLSLCVPVTTTQAPFVPKSLPQQADGPFSVDVVDNFLTNRCGTCNPSEGPALWSYEGTLTDPSTGKVIAEVVGLELIKRLPVIERSQLMENNNKDPSILDNLQAKKLIRSENTTSPQWDAAMTILSRRLFCYRRRNSNQSFSPEKVESSPCNSLLTSLRLRPDGPLRHLSPSESMSIYDSALTYISRNKGREMVVLSERGGCGGNPEDVELKKQFVMGHAEMNSSSTKSPHSLFEFSILARRVSERDGPIQLPLIKAVESTDMTISPPRSRFMQFGKGDGSDNLLARKYGSVRETYSYSFNNIPELADHSSSANDIFVRVGNKFRIRRSRAIPSETEKQGTVFYTRYGEAPPWYAPGRSCTLEVRGKLITKPAAMDIADGNVFTADSNLPTLALWAASKCNFWSGWPTIFSCNKRAPEGVDLVRQYYQLPPESDIALARRAIELFHGERSLSFDLMDGEYPIPERNWWLATTENVLSKVQVCIKRLSKSIIV